jgi:hypothetical protein
MVIIDLILVIHSFLLKTRSKLVTEGWHYVYYSTIVLWIQLQYCFESIFKYCRLRSSSKDDIKNQTIILILFSTNAVFCFKIR